MEFFSKLFYKSLSSYSTVKKPMNKNSELINYGFFFMQKTHVKLQSVIPHTKKSP